MGGGWFFCLEFLFDFLNLTYRHVCMAQLHSLQFDIRIVPVHVVLPAINIIIIGKAQSVRAVSSITGSYKGDISLQEFEELLTDQNVAEIDLPEAAFSRELFVTVRCLNKAGLVATMSSDGVTIIIKDKPTSDKVVVEILGTSPSQYPVHTNFQGTKDQLRIRWTGFEEEDWIAKYKVDIVMHVLMLIIN